MVLFSELRVGDAELIVHAEGHESLSVVLDLSSGGVFLCELVQLRRVGA